MIKNFNIIKKEIERLCFKYGIEKPEIKMARDDDPCDFTDYEEIRINIYQQVEDMFHARHVFGHYIADLHSFDNIRADKVADAIAEMLS
jgi:uncharacterized NAD(P)/FAD-binding protein YdhS